MEHKKQRNQQSIGSVIIEAADSTISASLEDSEDLKLQAITDQDTSTITELTSLFMVIVLSGFFHHHQ